MYSVQYPVLQLQKSPNLAAKGVIPMKDDTVAAN